MDEARWQRAREGSSANPGNQQGAQEEAITGRLFFAYFLLAVQKKVGRWSVREPTFKKSIAIAIQILISLWIPFYCLFGKLFMTKALAIIASLLLSGCTVGPDYQRPGSLITPEFKELKGWSQAKPRDTEIPKHWWQLFNDPYLNDLEREVANANQTIAQAQAQYGQAQALVQQAAAAYFPVAATTATVNRFRAASGQSVAVSGVRNLFGGVLSVAWEPDLWGSVRRQVEANTDTAQAGAANLQAITLSAQALFAQNYFQLRMVDAQIALLNDAVKTYEQTFRIIQNRYQAGVAAKTDWVQAETELEAVRARLADSGVQRAQLEHALAVLIGKTPTGFTIPALPLATSPPPIPVYLPSQLLERRPDIAAAERLAAAANAEIGVAKAAYYPSLNLAASRGTQSTQVSNLFTTAATYWALGPAALALPLFDGGARGAQMTAAIKNHESEVAAYRQTVLTAFREVEDYLAELRILAEEAEIRKKAVASANKAVELTTNQYQAGTVSYLNVMTAQATALTNAEAELQVQGRRMTAAVQLIKALGGGWDAASLPNADKVRGELQWSQFLPVPVN